MFLCPIAVDILVAVRVVGAQVRNDLSAELSRFSRVRQGLVDFVRAAVVGTRRPICSVAL